LAWASQRPSHGPGKLGLAQGAPVVVGYNEAWVNSEVFYFSFGLIQIKPISILKSVQTQEILVQILEFELIAFVYEIQVQILFQVYMFDKNFLIQLEIHS
jgi:hypothetical protein